MLKENNQKILPKREKILQLEKPSLLIHKKIFLWEAFLFFFIQVFGIFSAFKINKILKIEKVVVSPLSLKQFFISFILATLFILFILFFIKEKKKKGIIFKVLFLLATWWTGLLVLSIWISDLPALALMTFLVILWWKKPSVLIHDLCIIFGISGIGAILGLRLVPEIVIFLLLIFSIYDWIAVYKTKHMIKMAKEMIESRAILALICPPRISGFGAGLKEIKPGGKFLILGGGDVVFPLLLAVSLIPTGILNSFIIAFFALIGLFLSFLIFFSQKIRQPIPALPPIALFSIIGYLITLII